MENSKLTNCKACGAQVAKTAKTCPHCGAKVKRGHPVLIGILAVIILFTVIGAVGGSNEPKKVETPEQSKSTNIISTKAPEQTTEKAPE